MPDPRSVVAHSIKRFHLKPGVMGAPLVTVSCCFVKYPASTHLFSAKE